MSTNNNVFQVLVGKSGKTLLAKDLTLDSLTEGQIGVFNAETNLSIDATSPIPRHFFIAVGTLTNGLPDIRVSSGQYIQRSNMRHYTQRPHTASRPMIVKISNFKAKCDTDYAIKLEFRNSRIYRRQGYNQFMKTYAVRTACCEDCTSTCGEVDGNKLAIQMLHAFNADVSGFVTASYIAKQALTTATHATSVNYALGAVMTEADVLALITYNEANPTLTQVYADIRLTTVPMAIENYCSVNLKYHNMRETSVLVSLVEGFDCNGTVTVTQELAFEEGSGYDVRQKEYHALGWNGNPYVQSELIGMEIANLNYLSSVSTKYNQVYLDYGMLSEAGWKQEMNDLATIIAIPTDNETMLNSLMGVLDTLLVPLGFDALADDALLADANNAVVESTSAIDDVDEDGLS
jgi:hypothetical protein